MADLSEMIIPKLENISKFIAFNRQKIKAMLKKNIVTKFEKTRNATNSGYIMQF